MTGGASAEVKRPPDPTTRLRYVFIEAPDPEGNDRAGRKIATTGTEQALLFSHHLPAGRELATTASRVRLLVRPRPVTNHSAALFRGDDMIDLDINSRSLLAL